MVDRIIESPYRQRVYCVTQLEDDLLKSAVFALPDPEAHAGAWREENPLAGLSPDDLVLREGCAVFLRAGDGDFSGGTIGRGCASELRGASYAVSEVIVGPDRIDSWDRGFSDTGEQVWGAEKSAYSFLRK